MKIFISIASATLFFLGFSGNSFAQPEFLSNNSYDSSVSIIPKGRYDTKMVSTKYGFHEVTIDENNEISISHDNINCRLDVFGKQSFVCTRIAPIEYNGKAILFETSFDGFSKTYKVKNSPFGIVLEKNKITRLVQFYEDLNNTDNVEYAAELHKIK
ncbi:hypothetical protein [Fluviispira multicolorata]|uniref:Uncharacterized protein n=1 Tax=Fluviispira multicolorata TaxID=2654512 RepID=A0A833N6A8_9BACT|nr:hypothetical protein [Fluviispira multicolorata]KAB8033175.1 hypothetical protein GCL57_00325 [Fluviispira multicolorata]